MRPIPFLQPSTTPSRRPISVLLLLAVLACLGLSCGRKEQRLPVHPVRGKVHVDRKPAAHAMVVFHPIPDDPQAPRPRAYTNDDGSFTLSTYLSDDGAPVGEYIVTVRWPAPGPSDQEEGPDRLQERYADPKTPKIKATVKEGTNELKPFELK